MVGALNTILQRPVMRFKGFFPPDQRVKISGANSAQKLLENTDSSKGCMECITVYVMATSYKSYV
jgi:hypothetical protein